VWRGEAPYFPLAVIRPLVRLSLAAHVQGRLRTIQRYIYLDESLSDAQRQHLTSKVTSALGFWGGPGILRIFFMYILPVSGLVIQGYRYLFQTELRVSELPVWAGFLGVILLIYTLGFVITAFMVKRALMLGASGRAAYFPGALVGSGSYEKERSILGSVGIRKTECLFDITLVLIGLPIGYLSTGVWIRSYESIGVEMPSQDQIIIQMVV